MYLVGVVESCMPRPPPLSSITPMPLSVATEYVCAWCVAHFPSPSMRPVRPARFPPTAVIGGPADHRCASRFDSRTSFKPSPHDSLPKAAKSDRRYNRSTVSHRVSPSTCFVRGMLCFLPSGCRHPRNVSQTNPRYLCVAAVVVLERGHVLGRFSLLPGRRS